MFEKQKQIRSLWKFNKRRLYKEQNIILSFSHNLTILFVPPSKSSQFQYQNFIKQIKTVSSLKNKETINFSLPRTLEALLMMQQNTYPIYLNGVQHQNRNQFCINSLFTSFFLQNQTLSLSMSFLKEEMKLIRNYLGLYFQIRLILSWTFVPWVLNRFGPPNYAQLFEDCYWRVKVGQNGNIFGFGWFPTNLGLENLS